ncbi:hypothetical protein T484DRAFT_1793502 [Baffinella frigidus]|nr:hypothetical protein T484DRAFT_1793502 [Cryptophyta sp. CCMP2293]
MARDGKLPGQAGADFALAQGLWARAWAECDLPEAAYNLGVCAGKGYGGPQDCSLALQWYTACRDSDLDGRGRAGDAPVGGRHGSLEELVEVGPSDAQTTFAAPAARNLVAVGKMLAMQGECEVGMEMLRNLAIMKARDGL